MDKMTLAVKKNIAVVPVFNLCNKKQLDWKGFDWKYV